MPKATAVWLVDNTTLTFDQIADFTGLHKLEVQAIADGEVAAGIMGQDPVANRQLTQEEIKRCEENADGRLEMLVSDIRLPKPKARGARYTPISKRNDKPDAVAWMLKHQPELNDAQIGRLVGTTKPTINAVRDRTHWNSPNLRPRHPLEVGLCTRLEYDAELTKARARIERAEKKAEREARKKAKESGKAPTEAPAAEAEAPVGETPAASTEAETPAEAAPAPAEVEAPAETAGEGTDGEET